MSAGVASDEHGLGRFALDARLLIDAVSVREGQLRTPKQARQAAERASDEIVSLMNGHPNIVLLSGLGGSIGTGVSPVLARLALEHGHRVVAGLTLPFNSRRNDASPLNRRRACWRRWCRASSMI
jgi:cell division GTPase FtsZ